MLVSDFQRSKDAKFMQSPFTALLLVNIVKITVGYTIQVQSRTGMGIRIAGADV
jgi:hypothetical protein